MNAAFVQNYASHHQISLNAAEEAILAALTEVADSLSRSHHAFGSYTKEDIRQEAFLEGLMLLERDGGVVYCPSRSLAAYLFRTVRNRLMNLKRNKLIRNVPPCSCCDIFYHPKHGCAAFEAWRRRNTRKVTLALSGVSTPEGSEPKAQEYTDEEFVAEIEEFALSFPARLRADYLRIKAGVRLPADRFRAVQDALLSKFGSDAHVS